MRQNFVMPTHIVAVGAIIENSKNEILMVKTYDNGWTFPGGQVEVGENLIDALRREVKEETGFLVNVKQLFCVSSNTKKHKGYGKVKEVPTKVMLDFICEVTGGEIRSSSENSDTEFIHKDKVLNYINAPGIKKRVDAYLNFNGQITYLEYWSKPDFNLKFKRYI